MTLVVGRNPRKSALTLKLEARAEEVPCTHSCLCGYSVTGPTGQAREQLRAHRIAEHPERPAIAKRPKKPKPPKLPLTPRASVAVSRANGRPKSIKRAGPIGRPRQWERFTREQLVELYHGQRMSQAAIADHLGVGEWVIRKAMRCYGIVLRSKSDTTFITPAREEAAWKLYQAGLSGGQIAGLAWQTWGYSSAYSCRPNLLKVFGYNGRTLRTNAEAQYLAKMGVPEINRAQALAILEEAE